jgi:hypothetical protein
MSGTPSSARGKINRNEDKINQIQSELDATKEVLRKDMCV